jgi:hypothetical protein
MENETIAQKVGIHLAQIHLLFLLMIALYNHIIFSPMTKKQQGGLAIVLNYLSSFDIVISYIACS